MRRWRCPGASWSRILTVILVSGIAVGALSAGSALPAAAHGALPAKAKKALLVLSDFPKGWTSAKSDNNNSSFPGAAQLASCIGIPASTVNDNPPTVYSPTFSSKNSVESVQDNVSVYASAKAARADYESIANSKTPACLTTVLNGAAKKALQSGFGSGGTIGNVLVSRTPAGDYAPHTANFTAFIPFTSKGETLNLELTVVDYVKGTYEQTVTLTSIEDPFPTSLARHVTGVADGRI